LAKEKIQVPLTFELGWQRQETHGQATPATKDPADAQVALR